jgi:hypothetical protein
MSDDIILSDIDVPPEPRDPDAPPPPPSAAPPIIEAWSKVYTREEVEVWAAANGPFEPVPENKRRKRRVFGWGR